MINCKIITNCAENTVEEENVDFSDITSEDIFYVCDVRRRMFTPPDDLVNLSYKADDYHMCDVYNQSFIIRRYLECPYLTVNKQPEEKKPEEINANVNNELICTCYEDYEKMPFVCEQCNIRFPYKSVLKIHYESPTHILQNAKVRDREYFRKHHLSTCSFNQAKDQPYVCDDCDRRFTTKTALHNHVSRTHSEYKCNICKKSRFTNKNSFVWHQIDEHEECLRKCGVCGKLFANAEDFHAHLDSHSSKTYFCGVCNKTTTKFITHLKLHIQPPTKCDVCHKTYANKYYFQLHYIAHFMGKKFSECSMCEAIFPVKRSLDAHVRTHTNERPFQCDVCRKSFASKHILNCHYLTHTKEKNHVCPICNKRFGRKTYVSAHYIAIHTNERKYPCGLCNKSFMLKGVLTQHLRCIHSNQEKKFLCRVCGKGFFLKNGLKRHLVTHADELPIACEICDRKFSQKSSLSTHYRIHEREKELASKVTEKNEELPFACDICDERFKRKFSLRTHCKTHKKEMASSVTKKNYEKLPFACEICDRRFKRKFTLKTHYKIHEKDKEIASKVTEKNDDELPFACGICDRRFKRKLSLKTHYKIHERGKEVASRVAEENDIEM